MKVTGFDGGANLTIETQRKVTLMLQCNEKIIKHKVGLLNLAEELGNVCLANSYYVYKSPLFHRLVNPGGNGTIWVHA